MTDETFVLLFNAHHEPVTFRLPPRRFGQRWKLELSTAEPDADGGRTVVGGARGSGGRVPLGALLRRGW